MKYWVSRYSKDDWIANFSEMFVKAVFGTSRPNSSERVDFALVSFKDKEPFGFVSCIEFDSETLYWQFGGAIKAYQGTLDVLHGYKAAVDWSLDHYKMIMVRVDNDNIKILHLLMKFGFRVVGTFVSKSRILLELILERKD